MVKGFLSEGEYHADQGLGGMVKKGVDALAAATEWSGNLLKIRFSDLTGPTEWETLRIRHSNLSNKLYSWFMLSRVEVW